jgi:2-polyprenyl-3-methyl-5-hydroxy-6-metoxy-1,4-benzoquinol methylase
MRGCMKRSSSMQRRPFPNETFDLVVSDSTFEHVSDAEQVASELDRVLKPGGWICARTPNRHGYVALLNRLGGTVLVSARFRPSTAPSLRALH